MYSYTKRVKYRIIIVSDKITKNHIAEREQKIVFCLII